MFDSFADKVIVIDEEDVLATEPSINDDTTSLSEGNSQSEGANPEIVLDEESEPSINNDDTTSLNAEGNSQSEGANPDIVLDKESEPSLYNNDEVTGTLTYYDFINTAKFQTNVCCQSFILDQDTNIFIYET